MERQQNNNKMYNEGTNRNNENRNQSNTIKDPDNWTTGNEEMTGAQRSYLQTLASEAGEEIDENLTKAEASKKIDELQHKTGRGLNENSGSESQAERRDENEEKGMRGGAASV
ncbi:MAG TPA: DUF3072 domain-containing protein [Flavisolibacter sp.]|nr:DUF3072 domain-containing protein [Flavisolibacter sp.]